MGKGSIRTAKQLLQHGIKQVRDKPISKKNPLIYFDEEHALTSPDADDDDDDDEEYELLDQETAEFLRESVPLAGKPLPEVLRILFPNNF